MPLGRVLVYFDMLWPDRRRPRRAAQIGPGPHVVEGLPASRRMAERAHPQPSPGGRGEMGGAEPVGGSLRVRAELPMNTELLQRFFDESLGGATEITAT